jgi:hypothetical protein
VDWTEYSRIQCVRGWRWQGFDGLSDDAAEAAHSRGCEADRRVSTQGTKKGALPGISIIYHYQYFFTETGVFEGIRVFFHQGIGCGKFYSAKDCDSMLLQNEGLNEATVGELRMVTSTLQEGAVARDRAAGHGARLLRGEEHKDCDAAVRLQKEVEKNDLKIQKEETAKDTTVRTVTESGVMVYRHCPKSFVRQQWFRSHEDGCVEELVRRASNRQTDVL